MRVSLHHFTDATERLINHGTVREWLVQPTVLPMDGGKLIQLSIGEDKTNGNDTVSLTFRDLADAQAFEDAVRVAVLHMAEQCGAFDTPDVPDAHAAVAAK